MLPTQAASVRHISDMTHYTQKWRLCQAQISIFAFHDSTKEKGGNLLSDRKKPRSEWSLNHFLSGHVPDRKTSRAASAVRRAANRMEPLPVAIAQNIWNLVACGEQMIRAADCKNWRKSPKGFFDKLGLLPHLGKQSDGFHCSKAVSRRISSSNTLWKVVAFGSPGRRNRPCQL